MFERDFSPLDGKEVCSIVNPKAASKKWKRNRLLQRYLKAKLPGRIIDSHQDKAFTIQTAMSVCASHEVIVAAGGDGTIADIIQGIMAAGKNKDVVLGIIPLGSGNAFRKSLGIPKGVVRSIRLLAGGHTREIDLFRIADVPAAFASIGATAQVTQAKLQNRVPGLVGHLLAGKILVNLPRMDVDIELFDGVDDSGQPFERKAFQLQIFDCVIGKTSHFGYSWRAAPMAVVDDGYIDITFFEVSGPQYVLNFPRIYFGTFQKTQKHFKAKRAVFQGRDLPIQYHGEYLGVRDKIVVDILPLAMTVIVP